MKIDKDKYLSQIKTVRLKTKHQQPTPYNLHNNSFVIDERLTLSDSSDRLINDFLYSLFDEAETSKWRKQKISKLSQLKNLLASLCFASIYNPIRVSLDNQTYKSSPVFTGFLIDLVKVLQEQEYIGWKKGHHLKNKSRLTRIWPTEKLRETILNILWPCGNSNLPDEMLVVLKGKKFKTTPRKVITYRSSTMTKKLAKAVRQINLNNSQFKITFTINKREIIIIPDLHCSFYDDFKQGGRFYTSAFGHQTIYKDDRKNILINDQPTVELDYTGLHPRLLYAREGIQYDADPYKAVTDEEKLRPIVKTILLAIFNSNSYLQAVRAGNFAMLEDEQYRVLGEAGMTVADIIHLFNDAHKPISPYFMTKVAGDLMRIDSKITLCVLEHFASIGECCLPVHDSYIVEARLEGELREQMTIAYQKVTAEEFKKDQIFHCKICKG